MQTRQPRFQARSLLISVLVLHSAATCLFSTDAAGAETDRRAEEQFTVYKDQATNRMGVKNAGSGKILLPPEYDIVKPLEATCEYSGPPLGLFVVGNKPDSGSFSFGLLDSKGTQLLPPDYDEIGGICDGIIAVRKTGKWGFVDGNGKQLAAPAYDEVWSHGRNCAVVKVNEKYGAVDMDGNTVVEPVYDGITAAYPSKTGKYRFERLVMVRNGSRMFVDLKEAGVGERAKTAGGSGGAAMAKYKDGGKYGFRSFSGAVVVEPAFEDAWDFKGGYARVKQGGKWGFIDANGKMAVEPKYDYAWDSDGRKAKVRLDNGSTGYVDMTGKLLDE